MKTIAVRFYDGSQGTYFYLILDQKVEIGDSVVVHNGTEYGLAKVTDVIAGVNSKATKTIVSVINKDDYDAYVKANKEVTETKAYFRRLDELLAQESEVTKYRRLAESNAEAADILAKLKI